jgi:hypothetical protein
MLFKTDHEREMNLGSDYKFPPLEFGECNVNVNNKKTLSISEGDVLYLTVFTDTMMQAIIMKYNLWAQEND